MATLGLGGSSGLAFLGRRFELLLRVLCFNKPQGGGCSLWIQVCISLGHLKISSFGFALLAYPASPSQDNVLLCSQAVLIWWRVSFHLDLGSDSLCYQRQELLLPKPSHWPSSLILTFLGTVILFISYACCLFCLFNKLFLYRWFLAILRLEIKS